MYMPKRNHQVMLQCNINEVSFTQQGKSNQKHIIISMQLFKTQITGMHIFTYKSQTISSLHVYYPVYIYYIYIQCGRNLTLPIFSFIILLLFFISKSYWTESGSFLQGPSRRLHYIRIVDHGISLDTRFQMLGACQ